MTTEQKTQFIKEKCIKANPSIVELKFGCLEKRHYRNQFDENGQPEFNTIVMYANDKDVIFIEEERLMKPNEDYWCSKKEIIGRSITLEDILMAIDKKYKGEQFGTVATNGWFHFQRRTWLNGRRSYWTFGKPLTEQSEELKNFVYEILK